MRACRKHEWVERKPGAIRHVRECKCGAKQHRRRLPTEGEIRGTADAEWGNWMRGEW